MTALNTALLYLGGLLALTSAPAYADPCTLDSGSVVGRAVKEAARNSDPNNPAYEFTDYFAKFANSAPEFVEASKNTQIVNQLAATLAGTLKKEVNLKGILLPLCPSYRDLKNYNLVLMGKDNTAKEIATFLYLSKKAAASFNQTAKTVVPRLKCEVERKQKGKDSSVCPKQEKTKAAP